MATQQEIRESEQSMSSTLLEVVGPALIILMVGSLVFFLIEVFYRGPHAGRLCWVFGLFTFASVLVSRISIESGRERGRIFGFALGLAAFITSFTLVDFEGEFGLVMEPVLLISFICIVMWSAAKLTWDCTVIDKSRDVSATGITELVRRRFQGDSENKKAESNEADSEDENHTASDAQAGNLIRAFFRSKGERKNTPGIWVFYFSMAALPVFGIGQWFVKPNAQGGYGWVVFLFGVYLAAGLALMMTTSLLGLQRYLRKRDTYMPPEIARTWLGLGIVVAIVVLAFVMIFPRPNASQTLEQTLSWFTSPVKKSSEYAQGKDGQEEKDSGKGSKSSEEGSKSSSNAKTESTSGDSKDGKKTQSGGDSGKNSNSDSKSGNQDGQKSSDSQKSQGSENRNDSAGDKQKSDESDQGGDKRDGQRGDDQKGDDRSQENSSNTTKGSQTPNTQHSNVRSRSSMQNLSKFANWIVYLIAAIAAMVLLWLFRKEVAAFIQGLIAELKNLFGRKDVAEDKQSSTAHDPKPIIRPAPFAQFRNPFQGEMGNMSPEKIIEYTFRALEAWSFERGVVRSVDQTPYEFAERLGELDSEVGQSATRLSNLFCKNLFGRRKIRAEELEPLKELWRLMQNTATNSNSQIAFAN